MTRCRGRDAGRPRGLAPLPLLPLLLLLLAAAPLCHAAADSSVEAAMQAVACPFDYQRHPLSAIVSGERRPWLWVSAGESRRP